jgi:hypothetical protein
MKVSQIHAAQRWKSLPPNIWSDWNEAYLWEIWYEYTERHFHRAELTSEIACEHWEESEVFRTVVTRNPSLWDITPYSLLKVDRCFGGIYHLHLQCRRKSQERNQHEAGSNQSSALLTFKELHDVVCQKIGLFTV